jgi:hypothetical protein
MAIGAGLLIAIVPLQGHARNAASIAAGDLAQAHADDRASIVIVPPDAPLSRLPTGACGLNGSPNAEQRCLSELAYVLSPPPATRGMMPRYLPSISPEDAQPMPPVAAVAPSPRPALRQASRVWRLRGRQGCGRQGARCHLTALPRPPHAQRAGSRRQERLAHRLRFHRHRRGPSHHHRIKLHSSNSIERLKPETIAAMVQPSRLQSVCDFRMAQKRCDFDEPEKF